jgi:hypothetical protein
MLYKSGAFVKSGSKGQGVVARGTRWREFASAAPVHAPSYNNRVPPSLTAFAPGITARKREPRRQL